MHTDPFPFFTSTPAISYLQSMQYKILTTKMSRVISQLNERNYMHSPLESLAAFVIAFTLGIIFAIGLDLYTRFLRKR